MTCTANLNSKINYKVLWLALVLFGLSGCASMTDAQRTQAQGAATGALIGGLMGSLIGDDRKRVALGAVAGMALGSMYGKHVADRKQEFVNQEAYMQAVIAEADKVLDQAKNERTSLQADIVRRQQAINMIKQRQASLEKSNQSLMQVTADISRDIEKTEHLISNVENEIKIQKATLNRERPFLRTQLVSQSEVQISGLETEYRQLKLLKAQLANLDTRRMY